jgi:hypothetical protein
VRVSCGGGEGGGRGVPLRHGTRNVEGHLGLVGCKVVVVVFRWWWLGRTC